MRIIHPPATGGFTEEPTRADLGSPSKYLSPDGIRSRDTAKPDDGEVRIPLRVMVSRGFDEDRRPAAVETVFCGCFTLLVRVILCAALGSFLFGFNIALLNTSLRTISIDFHWCPLPGDTVFVGGALGSMTGGRFLFIGRRITTLLTMTVLSVGLVSSVIADSFATLVWARLIVGYGVGVISVVVPTYMSEMSPPDSRGFYGTFHQLFITMGIFVAVLLGLPLSATGPSSEEEKATYELPLFNRVWWRFMLGLGFVPVIICTYLLTFVMKFETPHYYVDNNVENEARKVLRTLHNKESVEPELAAIIKARNDALAAQKRGLTFLRAVQQPVYRRVIFVGCMLAGLQQLSGITIFIASSNDLFSSAKLSQELVTLMSTVLTFLNFVMTIPAIYLIDRLGRRTLMLIGTVGMGTSVLPGTVMLWISPDSPLTTWLAIGGSIAFIICFSATYGPVLWVYLFEIYPIEIKGVASGLATAVNWITGILVVFLARFIPVYYNFTLFCAMSYLTAFFVYAQMRETKGRSLEHTPYMD